MDTGALLRRSPSLPPLLRPPPPPASSSPAATALLRRPRPSSPPSSSVRAQASPPTSPENPVAVANRPSLTTTPSSSSVMGWNPRSLAKNKTPGSSRREMATRDDEYKEKEYLEIMLTMYRDFRRRAPLRHAARAAARRPPPNRVSAPVEASHHGTAGDKRMVAPPRRTHGTAGDKRMVVPPRRTPSATAPSSSRGLTTTNRFGTLAGITEDLVDFVLCPHSTKLSAQGGGNYNDLTSNESDDEASSSVSVGKVLIGEIEVEFSMDQYKWPELKKKQGSLKDATHAPLLPTLKEAALAAPVLNSNHAKEAVAAAPVLDTAKKAALPVVDATYMAAPLPLFDINHCKEAEPLAMLKRQAGQSSAAKEPARNPLAVNIGSVPRGIGGLGGGAGAPGGGGGAGAPGGGHGGGGGAGAPGGGHGGGGGGGGGAPGGGGPGGGGGGGGEGDPAGGGGEKPVRRGLRVVPHELPSLMCSHCFEQPTRYCNGCKLAYCPFCFCECSTDQYFLPIPSIVGGSCVLPVPVTLEEVAFPYIFIAGVREDPWISWYFARADDIFQLDNLQPSIPVVRYTYRLQGVWVVNMTGAIHESVPRFASFPAYYPQ